MPPAPQAQQQNTAQQRLNRAVREVTNYAVRYSNGRMTVITAWIVAMIVVGFDEWHNLGILPRPSRFWHTSVLFGILSLVAGIDSLTPMANLLAIGYMLAVIYQYYNGTGQFTSAPAKAPAKQA